MIRGALPAALAVTGGVLLAWQVQPRPAGKPLPWRSLGTGLVAAVIAAAAVLLVTGVPAAAVAAGATGLVAPWLRARHRRTQAADQAIEAWPEAIDVLRAAVRAGSPLPEAVAGCVDRVPDVLTPRFAAARAKLAVGEPFAKAVQALSDAPDPVAIRVCSVLELAHELGSGDTGRLLESLATFLRADVAQRREIAARHSWNVSAARVAVVAPWLTVAALSAQPAGRAAYASAGGTVLLLVVAAVTAAAYAVMSRVGRSRSAVEQWR